ncbi:TonB-dependent receptor [Aureibaculum sp. A20]|uniref:TonB-dependent receptor n=1 Tax=Aureibaculum flavum TaxID=2795986 RepID=A0ABS0WNV4_9FLAO|nr:TonB-dependent receptor [Aureibaculum flavum]MBJ2173671.1 TonB-dependent receptor [Aureibaculum flavum]
MKKNIRSVTLTIMRVFLLFISFGLTSVYANSVAGQTKIDINVKDITIKQLFKEIQNSAEYVFFYKDNVLNADKKVSIKLKNVEVTAILDNAFRNTDLSYKIIGKQIIVKKQKKIGQNTTIQNDLEVQENEITGTVKSESGELLIGVSVIVEGTSRGTQSDFDGKFTINVTVGATLLFSYLGMVDQKVVVGNKTVINVIMKEDAAALDEVMIVGYGTQSKESLTGSVGVVKSKMLEQVPVSTFEQALRGSMAGLQASAIDGAPGANTSVRIRGIGSITASSDPLYVIDGIPVQSGSIASNDNDGRSSNVMSAINPNDIESVTVLKDAASTAIYGSRGANGVILITTKSGKSGKPVFSFKSLAGFSSVASKNILKPINAEQYTQLYLEGYINRGDTPAEAQARFDNTFTQLIDPSTGQPTDTDWLDAITRVGLTQSYDLSARGGTESVRYFFSGSYYDQESFVLGSDFKRLSARANLSFDVNDYITIENNIAVADMVSNTFNDGGSWTNPFKVSLELSPLIPIYDESGRFNGEHRDYFPISPNPVGALSGDDERKISQMRITNTFAVNIKLMKNLKFRSQWNFDVINAGTYQYNTPRYGGSESSGGFASNATVTDKSWVGTQTLDYSVEVADNHNISLLAGYEAQESIREAHGASGTQFPNDKLRTLNSASAEFGISGSKTEYTFASMFARANYNYDGKYFLSSSIRRDGSSRFGADNRWGTFYSVGGSWIISKEDFLKDVGFLNMFKIRSSWGLTGNASIGNFPSQGLYTYGQDYDGSPGGIPDQIGNPDLTWETQQNFNIGLDFGIFSRVNGTVEYFKRTSSDLLLNVPISRTTGFSSITQNYGEMMNSGMEFSLNADIIASGEFQWNVGVNATFLKNEITKLTENYNSGQFRRQQGEDFQSFYLYGFAGIDADTGQIQWYTDESKTTITNSLGDAERFLDGRSASPDLYGGFNSSMTYKGFSLDASFNYSSGNYIFDSRARGSLADGRLTPRSTATWAFDNRWVPGKTDALLPMHVWGGSPGSGESNTSRWLYDGSFIRLRDLTLAYTIPTTAISALNLNSVKVYLRGTNLLTFTKDKDLYMDPEQAVNGTYDAMTPAAKTISLGIDIQF